MNQRAELLVLGGSGPIGRAISRAAPPARVVSVSRHGEHALDVGDHDALSSLVAAVSPCTIIYLVNDGAMPTERAVALLRNTALIARRHGVVRFLFASSAAVYGDQDPRRLEETGPTSGTTDYAIAKIRSEAELGDSGALSTLALRVFNVFGPGCVNSLVNRLAFGPAPVVRASRRFVRDYVHVDDVAEAFLVSARKGAVTGAINIARGTPVDNLDLIRSVPSDRYTVTDDGNDSFSVADVTRARDLLGWTAAIDPLAALHRGEPDLR